VIAIMTGCSNGEADKFRKKLSQHAQKSTLAQARQDFVDRTRARHPDLTPKRAHLIFDQIEGWAGFGFIEGHAASFALTGYRTAYLSEHHPAEYFAGMMNHQPMGFYSANTLAAEARRRGVRILPLDINESDDKCTAPDPESIRIGLRMVAGLTETDIETVVKACESEPFVSLLDFCIRVPIHRDRLENLILAGAFDTLHPHRRGLLFALDQTLGMALSYRAQAASTQMAADIDLGRDAPTPMLTSIDDFSEWERFLWTWRIAGVTAECHVFSHLRERLAEDGCVTVYDAQRMKDGTWVRVAGLNIRPHRPPTVSGKPVLFASVEDETDLLQIVCFGQAIDRCTPVFLVAAAVIAEGRIERRGNGASLQVQNAYPLSLKDIVIRTEIGRGQSRPSARPAKTPAKA
jgi:error-prone DNA polymerase